MRDLINPSREISLGLSNGEMSALPVQIFMWYCEKHFRFHGAYRLRLTTFLS